jgi:hypothetical protein
LRESKNYEAVGERKSEEPTQSQGFGGSLFNFGRSEKHSGMGIEMMEIENQLYEIMEV